MEELIATSISDYQSDVRAIVITTHSLIKYYTDTSQSENVNQKTLVDSFNISESMHT